MTIGLMACSILNAQKSRPFYLHESLNFIESISSYGAYENLDSNSRWEIEYAIDLCTYLLNNQTDSVMRSRIFGNRGRLYVKRRSIDSAKVDLENALDLDITNMDALDRLCFITTFHLKGYKKRKIYINNAVTVCENKCKTDSTKVENWVNLAEAYGFQRDFNLRDNNSKIVKCYKKCVLLDSNNSDHYYEISLHSKGKDKEYALRKALSIDEFWLYRSHLIALYAYEYKRYKEAMQLIDETIAIYEVQIPLNTTFMGTLYHFKSEVYKSMKNMTEYKNCRKKMQEYYDMD